MKTTKKFVTRYDELRDGERWAEFSEILAAYQANRIECPACCSQKVSDNGGRGLRSLSFCCLEADCGEQFDADSIAITSSR